MFPYDDRALLPIANTRLKLYPMPFSDCRATHFSPFCSVEELARYFGLQLRARAGGLWQRVVFDVAVSSAPGQAGIVRFAGHGCCCSVSHLANSRFLAAGNALCLVAALSGAVHSAPVKPNHRSFSTLRSHFHMQCRRISSSPSHSYKVANAVSDPGSIFAPVSAVLSMFSRLVAYISHAVIAKGRRWGLVGHWLLRMRRVSALRCQGFILEPPPNSGLRCPAHSLRLEQSLFDHRSSRRCVRSLRPQPDSHHTDIECGTRQV